MRRPARKLLWTACFYAHFKFDTSERQRGKRRMPRFCAHTSLEHNAAGLELVLVLKHYLKSQVVLMHDALLLTYLTVMGMEGLLSVSLSCSLAPVLINTYLFFSFSEAAAESLGPHLLWWGKHIGAHHGPTKSCSALSGLFGHLDLKLQHASICTSNSRWKKGT